MKLRAIATALILAPVVVAGGATAASAAPAPTHVQLGGHHPVLHRAHPLEWNGHVSPCQIARAC